MRRTLFLTEHPHTPPLSHDVSHVLHIDANGRATQQKTGCKHRDGFTLQVAAGVDLTHVDTLWQSVETAGSSGLDAVNLRRNA